jgi:hypothetical protein
VLRRQAATLHATGPTHAAGGSCISQLLPLPHPSGACSDDPKCADLFCPTYSLALAPDPVVAAASKGAAKAAAQPNEVFLAVGLDSGLTNFTRPKLNLVIVLDVSGSMDSSFDEYYYDRFSNGKKRLSEAGELHLCSAVRATRQQRGRGSSSRTA